MKPNKRPHAAPDRLNGMKYSALPGPGSVSFVSSNLGLDSEIIY